MEQRLFLLLVPTEQTVCLLFTFVRCFMYDHTVFRVLRLQGWWLMAAVRSGSVTGRTTVATVLSTEFPFRARAVTISVLCGNKMPTRCNRWFLLQILLLAEHISGHHYAHHQELKSIIQMVATCGTWCFGLQVVGPVWSCRLCVRFAGCMQCNNTLELLMMGIMVPETCWANGKFCNKEPSVASSWHFISTY